MMPLSISGFALQGVGPDGHAGATVHQKQALDTHGSTTGVLRINITTRLLVQELRRDRAVVLAAVQQNGSALCYATEERREPGRAN